MKWLLDVEAGKGKGFYQVVRDRRWYVPTMSARHGKMTHEGQPLAPPILYNVYQCALNYMPAVQYIMV